jgi:hypothetical protein
MTAEWHVKIDYTPEDILRLMKSGDIPRSQIFDDKLEAELWAFETALKLGVKCLVIHKDDLPELASNRIKRILSKLND